MKKLYFYKLQSHPDVKLIDHLRFVGDRSEELIKDKAIKFKYTKEELIQLAKVVGYCHDLGKGMKYFQNHMLKDMDFGDLQNHAHLSALFAYYNMRKTSLELAVIAYVVIYSHHGNLKNFCDYYEISSSEKTKILEQYNSLDEEVMLICEQLNIEFIEENELEDLIEELIDDLNDYNDDLGEDKSFNKYILFKYMFSLLIYSDKEHAIFIDKNDIEYDLPSDFIDEYKFKKFGKPCDDNIREIVYKDVIDSILKLNCEERIMSITLPTGSGKTYACMASALKLKDKLNKDMKIIYSLPFTSVIDQNYEDYYNAIKSTQVEVSSAHILKHHYLSPTNYEKTNLYFESDKGRFLTHNWNSQVVVTTFIQVFNTLFSNKNSDLIKFNTLANSIVLLDEVQSIPYKYWKIIKLLCKEISEVLNIYFIFITATQPLIFPKNEIKELASKSDFYFSKCKRTKLFINHESMEKEEFFEFVLNKIEEKKNKNIIIIVNTIKLSQELFEYINENKDYRELVYLSTSIVPKERKKRIEHIKNSLNKKVVISTQMVEAGVDIDMDVVIRDLAPLDSINQSAGRANREDRGEYLGEVYIVKVKGQNQLMAKYVYKGPILLQSTEEVLKDRNVICEEDYKTISEEYFNLLNKNKGSKEFNELNDGIKYLNFRSVNDKFQLIEDLNKVQLFIEIDEDANRVWEKYKEYSKIKDNFERRDKIESIKGDFYKYVISVFKNKCKEVIDENIGYVSKNQLENTYDMNYGYKSKEDSYMIF